MRQTALRIAAVSPLAKEPEDASLTGGTGSLDRRLLALNLEGRVPSPLTATKTLGMTAESALATGIDYSVFRRAGGVEGWPGGGPTRVASKLVIFQEPAGNRE